ncbi:MAG: BREX-3 system P-loop-containing protein BrxF [Chloroflexota bacterium]
MSEPLADQIIQKIDEVATLYHRLVLVVAPSGGGKTRALREVSQRTGFPYLNLNLELSRQLLDMTERQRLMRVSRLLGDMVNAQVAQAVLLDNTEFLFDPALQQNPLLLLQNISRNKVVVAAWNGTLEKDHLTYASPDHPEYHRYPARDLVIVTPG